MKIKSTYSPIVFLVISIIISAIIIVIALKHFLPLIIGIIISILIDPIVSFLTRKAKLERGITTAVVLSGIFCIFGYISLLAVSRLTFELARLIKFLPTQREYFNYLLDTVYLFLTNFFEKIPEEVLLYLKSNLNQNLSTAIGQVTNYYSLLVNKIGMIPNFFINIFVIIIFIFLFSYFLTKDKDKIVIAIKNLFPEHLQEKVKSVQLELLLSFFRLIKAQIFLVIVSTLITIAGFYILKVDYAMTLGIICGILDIMPLFGPSLIFLPWIIYLIAVGNIHLAMGILILYAVVIGSRQMLQAKVIGQNLGIDPLLTLLSIYLGIKAFGFKGLFVGPLVIVVVRALIHSGIIPPLYKSDGKV